MMDMLMSQVFHVYTSLLVLAVCEVCRVYVGAWHDGGVVT